VVQTRKEFLSKQIDAVEEGEKRKFKYYEKKRGKLMFFPRIVPFVLGPYGKWGEEAVNFIREILKAKRESEDQSSRRFQFYLRAISIETAKRTAAGAIWWRAKDENEETPASEEIGEHYFYGFPNRK
jgi:hypothetical protein